MNSILLRVTQRIVERSKKTRSAYLARIQQAKSDTVHRSQLACGNLAHGFAACQPEDKASLKSLLRNNIGIITSYNDMLSAHQPYETYPDIIRKALHQANAVGQVAGGVPAMCDGVTQGQDGMELSLLSREVIAMSAAVGLSHNMFDGALYLGVCDKIVPGLAMAALSFGHLPALFVPSGPMASGLANKEKVRIRQLYAEGKVDRMALLESEAASYHAPGTCTFYGTANTNQMVVEFMGMQLPGSSFVHPDAPLREALTAAAPTAEEIGAVSLSKLYVYYGSHENRNREGEGVWLVLNPGKKRPDRVKPCITRKLRSRSFGSRMGKLC